MKKNTTVVEIADLLFYAVELGMYWNAAHDLLFHKDRILSDHSTEIYYEEVDENNWSDETKKLLKGFMDKEGITKFLLMEG